MLCQILTTLFFHRCHTVEKTVSLASTLAMDDSERGRKERPSGRDTERVSERARERWKDRGREGGRERRERERETERKKAMRRDEKE